MEKRKQKSAPVEIFTPAELDSLLAHASVDVAPCIALSAFAGLRAEEVLRLEWEDLERRPGLVEVAAHKAKTAQRRLVPISENLRLWLAQGHRRSTFSKPYHFESLRCRCVSLAHCGSRSQAQWTETPARCSRYELRPPTGVMSCAKGTFA